MAQGEFTHIEIPADDTARAQRFYADLFGWKFQAVEGFEEYFLYTTAAGENGVGGAIGKRDVSAPHQVRNYVDVDSVDESVARATELGGSVVESKAEVPGQGWYAVITDTEGNEFAVWQSLSRQG
jgi:predicted enzyme related to lactoylglutathione lyase